MTDTAFTPIASALPRWMGLRGLHLVATLLFAGLALPAVHVPAQAQSVVALVNSSPVTSFDIEQRIRIAALTERRRLDRKSALRELVDDKVKLIEARRVGYRITEEGVEAEFLKMAKGNGQNVREFSENLKKAGIQPNALRDKIRADLAWVVLLRDQARRGSQVTNSELESAIEEKRRATGTVIEYTMRQVVFIVPQGGSAGARQQAANAARGQFDSCDTGFDALRRMKDVAVRGVIVRTSQDLSKPLLALLDKTPVGRLTPPSVTSQGVEMVALCGKKERTNPSALRSEVAVDLSEKKITANAKNYIEELRKKVDIKYR